MASVREALANTSFWQTPDSAGALVVNGCCTSSKLGGFGFGIAFGRSFGTSRSIVAGGILPNVGNASTDAARPSPPVLVLLLSSRKTQPCQERVSAASSESQWPC